MKPFKKFYFFSLISFYIEMCLIFIPTIVLLGIILSANGMIYFYVFIIYYFAIMFGVLCALSLLLFLINWVIRLFIQKAVYVEGPDIFYGKKQLNIYEVKSITVYLPEVKAHFIPSPLQLSIYCDNENQIFLRRPSISLIRLLKKRCYGAKFEVLNLKNRIKVDFIVGLCCFVVLLLFSMFV